MLALHWPESAMFIMNLVNFEEAQPHLACGGLMRLLLYVMPVS